MRWQEIISERELSPDLMRWFGNSKVTNIDGTPRVCYHGTKYEFDSFAPQSHFGTALAAKERLADRGGIGARTIPVYLRITNPLRVTDQDASDEATMLNSTIRGKYPNLDSALMRRDGIEAALEAAGYDGMVYENGVEDRGRDSWVILRPDQSRSIFS